MKIKKNSKRILALLLVALLALGSVVAIVVEVIMANTAMAEAAPPRDEYVMSVDLLEGLDALRVDQQLTYTNRTGQKLTQVVFNLYPNAFRREFTVPFEADATKDAYPDGFAPGGVDFFLIEVDGTAADWGVQGNAEAFLRVAAQLEPGQSCTFRFGFEVLLPNSLGLIGARNGAYRLGAFYPMVAPWDDHLSEFMTANPYAIGRTLMADPADYKVTFNAPKGWQLAAPGAIESADDGERTTWHITAPNIRQFAVATAKNYRLRERAGGVAIRALMQDAGAADRALDAAEKAVDFYASVIGAYPFDQLTIAEADLMEPGDMSSGLILIDDGLTGLRQRDELEYQVAFQVAKQWFFEKVSHNPAREPWLSEAPASYMALRYYDHVYGETRFLNELNARVLPALKLTIPGLMVDSETIQFQTMAEYRTVIRDRGTASMYEMDVYLGKENFYGALRDYVDKNAGKMASLQDFVEALSTAAGGPMEIPLMRVLQQIDEYAHDQLYWYE